MTRRLAVCAAALVLGLSTVALAAAPRPGMPAARPYAGQTGTITPLPPAPTWQEGALLLGPASFQVRDCMWSQAYLEYEQDKTLRASFRVTEGYPYVSMAAPLHLPYGAEITTVRIDYFDTDPNSEPSMGVYSLGPTGEAKLVADTSGVKGFEKGENTVMYKVMPPSQDAVATTYEFLVTLNRSVTDPTQEHALFRVDIRYRYPLR